MSKLDFELPFAISDFKAVGALAERYLEEKDPEAERLLHVWCYLFLRRYYAYKFYKEELQLPQEVEDLISQAYLHVWNSVHQVKEPQKFGGWVLKIASSGLSTYFRKKKRQPVSAGVSFDAEMASSEGEVAPDPSPLILVDLLIYREILLRAVRRLPDYLRKVVYMKYFDQLSNKEIAQRIGRTPAVIRSYLQRAHKRLRNDPEVKNLLEDIT